MDTSTQHATALGIVHEEAGRMLSKADFDLCMRIAKRLIAATVAPAAVAPLTDARAREIADRIFTSPVRDAEVLAFARALAAPTPTVAPAAPQGWKLVPVEPTPEMHRAGETVASITPMRCEIPAKAWDAMLAAAPLPTVAADAAGAPIYQTCFIQGQWRDVDRAEYERAVGLRADLARIVYAAPVAPTAGVPIPGSPAYALRGLYKPAMEYFIDGKPCTPDEYIHWQAGIIEAVTKAKLPDPKYYGGQEEDGDQHEVRCAYVDGWNDCRAKILAAPTPTVAADAAAPSDERSLRRAVAAMVTMLESGEWAEHASTCWAPGDELAAQLESAITDLHNEIHADEEAQPDERAADLAPIYAYEWDCGPGVVHRDFDHCTYNGRYPDRTLTLYTRAAAPQAALTDEGARKIVSRVREFILGYLSSHVQDWPQHYDHLRSEGVTQILIDDIRDLLATPPTERMSDAGRMPASTSISGPTMKEQPVNISFCDIDTRVDWYRKKLFELVHAAMLDCVVLTIDIEPTKPFRMGAYILHCHARPARNFAEAHQAELTDEQIMNIADSYSFTWDEGIVAFARALLATAPTERMSDAARDVLAERARQVNVEGWAPEHDDEHDSGEMADAAAAYALHASGWTESMPREVWPADWSQTWWKPTTPRRDLIKAGALILAEIERLDRAARKAEIERSDCAGGEA